MEAVLAHMGEGEGVINGMGQIMGQGTTGWGMMGGPWMMGVGAGPVWWWIGGILWWLTWILLILALAALVRWLWKKGNK